MDSHQNIDVMQGSKLSRFSWKLHEFEAHFMRLRILWEFHTQSTLLRQNGTDRTEESFSAFLKR